MYLLFHLRESKEIPLDLLEKANILTFNGVVKTALLIVSYFFLPYLFIIFLNLVKILFATLSGGLVSNC